MCDHQMVPGPPITSPGILPWDAAKILLIFVSERQKLEFLFSLINTQQSALD